MTAFGRDETRARHSFSATTTVAALTAFALAASSLVGDYRVAAAAAVAVTALLAMREGLHGWVRALSWEELRSGIVLLAMTFIVLPVLPSDPVGPFGGVDLREVWIIAIVLAAVSFAGYLGVKYFGARHGVMLAAAAGGLVSSTAVTLINARRAAAHEGEARLLVAGVSLATAISFVRVFAIALVLQPQLLRVVGPSLIVAVLIAGGIAVAAAYWPAGRRQRPLVLRNPFQFWPVVGFAALLAVMILAGQYLGDRIGAAGTTLGAALLGIADVDAVTISMARLVPEPLSATAAGLAVLAAVATNTLSKLVIGAGIGGGAFARDIAIMAVACYIAGGLALWASLAWLAY
jgi:uncharacterized membrane protein (DUF4010 family)